jgi:hypothetical protein
MKTTETGQTAGGAEPKPAPPKGADEPGSAGSPPGGRRANKPASPKGADKPASSKPADKPGSAEFPLGGRRADKPASPKHADKPASPKHADKPVLIDSLPMARYGFVVHGYLTSGARISIKGIVYARKDLYYQARARVLDSILKEIPTLELDENPIGLKMQEGKRCVPPEDLSLLGRPKS